MENPLEPACVGINFGWGRASENYQGGENSVSQVNGVSGMALTCWLCGSLAEWLRKGTMCFTSTCLGESYPPALVLMLDSSVPARMLLVPFELLPQN